MRKSFISTVIVIVFLLLSDGLQAQNNQPKQRGSGAVPVVRIYHSLVYHSKTDNILVFAGLTKRGWIMGLFTQTSYLEIHGYLIQEKIHGLKSR